MINSFKIGNTINNSPKLSCYRSFKRKFCFEAYLDKISNQKLLKSFARFRFSSHNLEIETDRFSNIPRDLRLCKICNGSYTETEFHFLLCCPKFTDMKRNIFATTAGSPNLNLVGQLFRLVGPAVV